MFKGFHKKYKNAKRFSIKKSKGCYTPGTRRAHDVKSKALRKQSIDDLAKSYIYKKSRIQRSVSDDENINQMINTFRLAMWKHTPSILAVLNESRRELVMNRCKELIEQVYD